MTLQAGDPRSLDGRKPVLVYVSYSSRWPDDGPAFQRFWPAEHCAKVAAATGEWVPRLLTHAQYLRE